MDRLSLLIACRVGLRGAAVLAAGLLFSSLLAPPAHADLAGCRSDPVVTLSNGVTLDLSAMINASASDVQQTIYVLHAPVGTYVVSVVGTDGLIGLTERFYFSADRPAHAYAADTIVETQTSGVSVTATTAVVSATGTGTVSAAGQSAQDLLQAVTL